MKLLSNVAPALSYLLPLSTTVSPQGVIAIAGHAVSALAAQYGTPLYIYDHATIESACNDYQHAFQEVYHASPVRMLYASKAYLSPALARLLAEQGFGLDVVSAGELLVAQAGQMPMERVSFHGNNKSERELRQALSMGVGCIVLDNWYELALLTHLAQETATRPRVMVRVAPEVETNTHRYLQTGHASAKFGFALSTGEARAAILRILDERSLDLVGLHAHSGTMLREVASYQMTLHRLLELATDIYRECGWWPAEISPGGGWGIQTVDVPEMPAILQLARAFEDCMRETFSSLELALPVPTLVIEPGRSLIARAGVAVYRVGARKVTPGGITYLFVDGGMADNIRPALYGAHYTALPGERALAVPEEQVCVAGRYCESGDVLIEQVALPRMDAGELLLLPTAGAYCLPMASNYNLVPRPAVVLVSEQGCLLMERRETENDLLKRYG